jgi:hypothetical protein
MPAGATRDCTCVYVQDIKANLSRIWKGILDADLIEESQLKGRTEENLRITTTAPELRRHLRHVGVRMGTRWSARVVSDADLMSAWLATVAEVIDPDVTSQRIRSKGEFFTLSDIALAHDLLIIVTGVKAAKNREMPSVLLETVQERTMEGKPTWVVDSPAKPLKDGHIAYSDNLWETLREWEWVILSNVTEELPKGVRGPKRGPVVPPPATRPVQKRAVSRPPPARMKPPPPIEDDEEAEDEEDDGIDTSFMGDIPMEKDERLDRDERLKKEKRWARERAKRGKK